MVKYRWRYAAIPTAVCSALVFAGGFAVQASASLQDDTIVSANPANYTPDVLDDGTGKSTVMSTAQVGNTVVSVGDFKTVTQAGSTYARTNIFAFAASTGTVSTTFVPAVNGIVNKVLDAGDGQSVYIVGKFSTVNGVSASHVARLNVSTGQLITGFKPPSINGDVIDVALRAGRLYVSGAFTAIKGQPQTSLAALDPSTGALLSGVNLTFSGTWNGGRTFVRAIDLTPDGSRLVAIGNFTSVNGQSRPQIAMIDTNATPAALDSWATTRFTTTCSSRFETYLWEVSVSPTGDYFTVVATGAFSGGLSTGTLCDSASRWPIGTAWSGPGQNPAWVDYTGGDTMTAASSVGRIIYVGGHFRWLNNPYASDSPGPGAVARTGLAALDARNGLPLSWNPTRNRGFGVRQFTPVTDGLYISHDTNFLGHEAHQRLAFMPVAGGTALPPENTGTLPGEVYLLSPSTTGGDAVSERTFDGTQGGASQPVAGGGESWGQVKGAFMVDGMLYYGKADGTFHKRSFDGTTFGPDQVINLTGASTQAHTFVADLKNVTGMFYDRNTARIYYTMSGSSSLYYRYFLPESDVVGAVRFTGPSSPSGLNWATTSGMFFVSSTNKLYAASTTGVLYSMSWINGSPGTASPVVGSSGWAAKGLALDAQ
jgi:hypothetical protein